MRRGWPLMFLLLTLAASACLLTAEATSQFVPAREQLAPPRADTRKETGKPVLPKGTSIHVRLTDPIRMDFHRTGDSFNGVLDRAIKVDDQVVAPEKSRVIGEVTKLTDIGEGEAAVEIELTLRQLKIGAKTIKLETETLEFTVPRGDEAIRIYRQLSVDPEVIYRAATRLTFKLSKPVQLSLSDRPGR